ncbi:putative barnase/colicin E5 family endoribonuclease, partial [Helicobacter vulpis]|uniref:putative barnase/colicin E5 family endoribonuclease n=1 Tax=Helicobacter vulpis TaxID=2316076 RepID=UPI002286F30C
RVDDLLRGAFIAPKESIDKQFKHILESLQANPSIEDINPRFIKTQDNYQGAHINFTYEGISSEIQVHTPKSWETKKKQDPYYKELRREKLHPRLTKGELKKLRRRIRELGQESDLDISFFTSSKLTSPQYSPVQSELVTKSAVDLNATQEPPLNSKAGSSSASGTAYNRLDSKLNQKSTSLTGGKGIETDIQTPLSQSSTPGLKGNLEQEWLKAFGLKSVDEDFTPQFSKQVQEALAPVLQGEQIKLTKGSLVKLSKRQREEFLPLIKPALEKSDAILKDKENALIFVKDIGKKYYFTSVAKSNNENWTIRTNSYKTLNRLKNVMNDGGEVLYMGEKAPNILAETFKVKTFSNQLAGDSNITGLKGQETGFKGGEVAGASDILESGGTAIKPSDLQINTPPKHGSALNPAQDSTKPPLNNQIPLLPYKPNTHIPATSKEILAAGRSASLDKQDILDAIRFKNKLLEDILKPNPAFGENFKEFALKGKEAVSKLLKEKRGQVSGAFYKEGLGYIDLVWGEVRNKEGKIQGHGLSKIVEKHLDDFSGFEGGTPLEKLGNGIEEIVSGGVLKEVQGVKTIHFTNKNGAFKIGLSQGWDHQGDNHWVITAYKVRTPSAQLSDQAQLNKGMGYSSPKGEHDPSVEASKSQGSNSDSLTKGETLPLNSKAHSTKPPLKKRAKPKEKKPEMTPEEEEQINKRLEE